MTTERSSDELRVEEVAARASVSVDTVRYYQSKGLLDPPRRAGRIAWYGGHHLERLARIRDLQQRGFTLATIARLLSGELDAADEALLAELTGPSPTPVAPAAERGPGSDTGAPATYTLAELARATGVPLALLKALEAEGLLVPRRIGTRTCYTDEDVAVSRAGLLVLEWGVPLTDLLELARRHNRATEAVATGAVELFSHHVREPLRQGVTPDALAHGPAAGPGGTADPAVDRLLQAYAELLPAVTTLVAHHFARTLVRVALDHVEQVGTEAERHAVFERLAGDTSPPAARAGTR